MTPTKFKQHNIVFAKDQKEYLPLPAHKVENDPQGRVITCWKMSFKERMKALFFGRVWIQLLTFNQPLTPILPSIDQPFNQ